MEKSDLALQGTLLLLERWFDRLDVGLKVVANVPPEQRRPVLQDLLAELGLPQDREQAVLRVQALKELAEVLLEIEQEISAAQRLPLEERQQRAAEVVRVAEAELRGLGAPSRHDARRQTRRR